MLSSRKKIKEPILLNILNSTTDSSYSYDPSSYGQESYKRISQLSGVAVDNKDKIQYIPTTTPPHT